MADVFVSYASEDRDHASLIVDAVEAAGLSVWWDIRIGIGSRFDMEIEGEIDRARCVVVLWSSHSVSSDWVRAEAGEGLQRGVLVQVLLNDLRPPLVFRQQQGFRFTANTDLTPLIEAIERTARGGKADHRAVRQNLWLVADLENQTNEPSLTGTLAAALEIGLDQLTDVFLYPRDALLSLAERYQAYLPVVRELARREGLDYVLAGTVDVSDGLYVITLNLWNVRSSEILSRSTGPSELAGVLDALALGLGSLVEATGRQDTSALVSAVQRLSLCCLYEDLLGFVAQARHQHETAVQHFQAALNHDESFVPSCLGLAISFDCLDRQTEGGQALERTLTHLDELSERKRLRTLGMYYLFKSENYGKALEQFEALLEISPLEIAAINNAALARCNLLDFDGAVETLTRAVNLAPEEPFYRVNLALYRMYAGQFDRAIELSRRVIAEGMDSVDAHVALGCSLYAIGEYQRAVDAFTQLSSSGQTGRLQGAFALVDLALARGEIDRARSLLDGAAATDSRTEVEIGARIRLLQTEIHVAMGQPDAACATFASMLDEGVDVRLVAAGSIAVCEVGAPDLLAQAADRMRRKLDGQSQAYLRMVEGLQCEARQHYSEAERAFRSAIEFADLWMLHYVLAELYTKLEMGLEAKLERDVCLRRSGEGVTAWINRMPTCRYVERLKQGG